jgi:hypothetical protein
VRALYYLLVLIVVVLAAAGCWGRKKPTSVEPSAPATLHVENRHWLDVDLYAIQSGHRMRLGSITATSTKDFAFPPSVTRQLAPIQLLAAPVGSPRSLVTESIVVKPGTRVDWTLESNLATSTLSVY